VIVQAQQGGHGGMVAGSADRRWHAAPKQIARENPDHTGVHLVLSTLFKACYHHGKQMV
jgi:hypothetical protein